MCLLRSWFFARYIERPATTFGASKSHREGAERKSSRGCILQRPETNEYSGRLHLLQFTRLKAGGMEP
jgi:hypothetical protein